MKKKIGKWALTIWRIVSGTYGQPFHFRVWDAENDLKGWRKTVCEITRKTFIWSMEANK